MPGDAASDFATTAWSRLCHGPDAAARRAAFGHLADRYWKPAYAYIRRRRGRTVEDAQDLTQEFFAWALESDLLTKVERGRGRFRGFLKTVLDNFMAMDERARGRLRRGGDRRAVPLEIDARAEAEWLAQDRTPEQVLHEAWKATLLEQAVVGLRAAYEREGRAVYFRVFEEYDLAGTEAPTHAALAARHGLQPTDVGNYLTHARARFRRTVLDLLADSVGSAEALQEELRELFAP